MAIIKHIKSRNANYSAAINYLLFEHDEKTGKKIVDESRRGILRKEFLYGWYRATSWQNNTTIYNRKIWWLPPSPCGIKKAGTGCQNPAPAFLIEIFCFLIFIGLY